MKKGRPRKYYADNGRIAASTWRRKQVFEKHKRSLGIWIDERLKWRLEEYCSRKQITLSQAVEQAIANMLASSPP